MIKLITIVFLCCILLLGCSGTKTVTITEVDTVIVHDTIQLVEIDSIWHGGIYNDKDSIGSIAVNPKSKTALVNIKWLKPDTIYYEVPTNNFMILESVFDRMMKTFFTVMPFYQKLILIVVIIALVFVYIKIKGSKK